MTRTLLPARYLNCAVKVAPFLFLQFLIVELYSIEIVHFCHTEKFTVCSGVGFSDSMRDDALKPTGRFLSLPQAVEQ